MLRDNLTFGAATAPTVTTMTYSTNTQPRMTYPTITAYSSPYPLPGPTYRPQSPQIAAHRRHGAQRGAFGSFEGYFREPSRMFDSRTFENIHPMDLGHENNHEDVSDWFSFRHVPEPLQEEVGNPGRRGISAEATTETIAGPTPGTPNSPAGNVPDNQLILTRITDILDQIVRRDDRPRIQKGSLPYHYSGREEENPIWFVQKIEEFFINQRIYDDVEKILYVGGQLHGEAKRWYTTYMDLSISYNTFRDNFLLQFNSPQEWSRARAKLYGTMQREGESVEKFLLYKRRLFTRLEPYTPDYVIIQLLVDQFRPYLRSRL